MQANSYDFLVLPIIEEIPEKQCTDSTNKLAQTNFNNQPDQADNLSETASDSDKSP